MPITRRMFQTMSAGALLMTVRPAIAAADTPANWNEALAAPLSALERTSGGRLGVAVLNKRSGVLSGYRIDERFPMASTFKTLAAAAVLAKVDGGGDNLNRTVTYSRADLVDYSPATETHVGEGMTLEALCESAVTLSDNTAANLMLQVIDGPEGFTRYARSLGDEVTRLDRTEPTLNEALPGDPRDTTSPAAMAHDLDVLIFGTALKPASRELLTGWLKGSKTGAARLRAGVPKEWVVGDKTGTASNGTANDAGILWPPEMAPLIVTVYLTGTSGSSDDRNAVIANVARQVVTLAQG